MTSRSDLCWFVDADDDDDDDAVPTEAPFVAAQWIALTPKGCEPVANDPIAKNRGVFVFAGRDASRRYQFVCVKCNYGDRKPFTMTARHTSDVDTAAKRHAQKVHSLLRNRDEHGVPFSLGDHRGYTQWRSICFRTPSQQGYPRSREACRSKATRRSKEACRSRATRRSKEACRSRVSRRNKEACRSRVSRRNKEACRSRVSRRSRATHRNKEACRSRVSRRNKEACHSRATRRNRGQRR